MVKILIPTIKPYNEIAQQIKDIYETISLDIPVMATCRNLSAGARPGCNTFFVKDNDTGLKGEK